MVEGVGFICIVEVVSLMVYDGSFMIVFEAVDRFP